MGNQSIALGLLHSCERLLTEVDNNLEACMKSLGYQRVSCDYYTQEGLGTTYWVAWVLQEYFELVQAYAMDSEVFRWEDLERTLGRSIPKEGIIIQGSKE